MLRTYSLGGRVGNDGNRDCGLLASRFGRDDGCTRGDRSCPTGIGYLDNLFVGRVPTDRLVSGIFGQYRGGEDCGLRFHHFKIFLVDHHPLHRHYSGSGINILINLAVTGGKEENEAHKGGKGPQGPKSVVSDTHIP